jgi:hypothetical protein
MEMETKWIVETRHKGGRWTPVCTPFDWLADAVDCILTIASGRDYKVRLRRA